MEEGKLMLAWAIRHNSHGIYYDTLCFLPEGHLPESRHEWVRVSWLDEPAKIPEPTPEPSDGEPLRKKPKTKRKKKPEKLNEMDVSAITNG